MAGQCCDYLNIRDMELRKEQNRWLSSEASPIVRLAVIERRFDMNWSEICATHPDKWLIVDAFDAHTTPDHQRHLEQLTVVEECPDGIAAMKRYRLLHQQYPEKEFYFLHTSRKSLDIQERQWLGIRAANATDTKI